MRLSYKLLVAVVVGLGLVAILRWAMQTSPTKRTPPETHAVASRINTQNALHRAARLRHAWLARQFHKLWQEICARFPAPEDTKLVVVDVHTQALFLLDDGRIADRWPISTSVDSTDQVARSDGTPLGVFRIARKLGSGLPAGAILRDQAPTGQIAVPVHAADDPAASGLITTRILWLSGLQPGWNEDGDVDTFSRHIYIHGTPNLGMLGRPASHGCVQMAPHAVITLFRAIPVGTPVAIIPGTGSLASIPGPSTVG